MSIFHNNDKHQAHLQAAFASARAARAKGNGPYGAVLVSESGDVLLTAENTVETERDVTGHAETNVLREAYRKFDTAMLAKCTLYSSAEPCPMCAGTIYWSGIGKVVFGLGIPRLNAMAGGNSGQAMVACRDIVASGAREVEVIGPLFEDDAAHVFDGYF